MIESVLSLGMKPYVIPSYCQFVLPKPLNYNILNFLYTKYKTLLYSNPVVLKIARLSFSNIKFFIKILFMVSKHTYQANPSCPCYNYYMYVYQSSYLYIIVCRLTSKFMKHYCACMQYNTDCTWWKNFTVFMNQLATAKAFQMQHEQYNQHSFPGNFGKTLQP